MAIKKRTKTRDKLLSIPKDEMDKLGIEVARLMENEMSFLVNKYMYKYRNSTASTFGWNEDDLRQHIMIILWKGAATYDPARKVKLTTYLSTMLYYQMGNLSKSIQNDKNTNSKLYCPEDLYDSPHTTDYIDGEQWASYSMQFKILMDKMTGLETKVLTAHLLNGDSITQMQKNLKLKRPEIISAVKSLKGKMNHYLGDSYEENYLH